MTPQKMIKGYTKWAANMAKLAQAKTVLNALNAVLPNRGAVIVGGAIRDLVLDREIRDVDIYCHLPKIRTVFQLIDLLHDLHLPGVDIIYPKSGSGPEPVAQVRREGGLFVIDPPPETEPHDMYGDKRISFIAGLRLMDGLEIDVMVLYPEDSNRSPLQRALEDIATGICKAAFDGLEYHVDPLFMQDVLNQTITVDANLDDAALACAMRDDGHVAKMVSYFPEYKLKGVDRG